ncbi:hypothetical protein XA68_18121 [Ophiocordyceps unilateralis]|uniref:Uncharacterized protein n=1 Tax=Ophiocordyceps unilateralis TaxID=268505 RepID=A0A2A9P2G4_OPHUN|nr:hypothetical protein XA68_18121 [Ophiocordyceps unilateralis]
MTQAFFSGEGLSLGEWRRLRCSLDDGSFLQQVSNFAIPSMTDPSCKASSSALLRVTSRASLSATRGKKSSVEISTPGTLEFAPYEGKRYKMPCTAH